MRWRNLRMKGLQAVKIPLSRNHDIHNLLSTLYDKRSFPSQRNFVIASNPDINFPFYPISSHFCAPLQPFENVNIFLCSIPINRKITKLFGQASGGAWGNSGKISEVIYGSEEASQWNHIQGLTLLLPLSCGFALRCCEWIFSLFRFKRILVSPWRHEITTFLNVLTAYPHLFQSVSSRVMKRSHRWHIFFWSFRLSKSCVSVLIS